MNSAKFIFVIAAIVLGPLAAADADARNGHFRHHHHHRSHVGVWFTAPGPFFYPPAYYYPRYYYPPAVVMPAPVSSPLYVERPATESVAPAESSAGYWYYCRDTQTYYPYVQQCASPWERVVPSSGPPS
jgi:hypothetical protein